MELLLVLSVRQNIVYMAILLKAVYISCQNGILHRTRKDNPKPHMEAQN